MLKVTKEKGNVKFARASKVLLLKTNKGTFSFRRYYIMHHNLDYVETIFFHK
jgi:hypothetical protein